MAPSVSTTPIAQPRAELPPAPSPLPRHLAIIMDGNGRWAKAQGWARSRGHREGAESVRAITRECSRLGIEALTLDAFSSDNWRRPRGEVVFLMRLLLQYLVEERGEIMENGIRLRAIGETGKLPSRVKRELERTMDLSRGNTGLT